MEAASEATAMIPSRPLAAITLAQLGGSRAGALMRAILMEQGANQAAPAKADILIDDRPERAAGDIGTKAQIVIRLTDFPASHPAAGERSHFCDEMIHAELGLNRMARGGELLPEPLRMASSLAAIWGAIYASAGLHRRDRSGEGSRVDLSLFSAAMTVFGRRLVSFSDPTLVDPLDFPHLPSQEIYACADGRYVQSHGTYQRFARILCNVFGHQEWADEAAAGLDRLPDRAAEQAWRDRLGEEFRKKPALHWERVINEAEGSCTMCRTPAEWSKEPHAIAAEIFTADGKPGAAVRVRAPAGALAPPASPREEHWPAGDAMDPALPLAGVRVVDFSIILAGPTCGRMLAELGADVIKIDAADRPLNPLGWIDVNRAKRSVLLDLRKDEARAVAERLVMSADVVLQNFRQGKLAALGFGYEDVRRKRPDIVYASLNAFDFGGPWTDRAGWEHNAQAATGMQVVRAENGVAQPVPVPINDYGTGLLGACGVVMALRHAKETGLGAHVTASLARTGTFMQRAAGYEGEKLPEPQSALLRCADGWVRYAPAGASGIDSAAIARLGREEAAPTLRRLGCEAVVERTFAEIDKSSLLDDLGLRWAWEHPHWGSMRQAAAAPELSSIAKSKGWPAPDRGDHTVAVLSGMGLASEAIDALVQRGAAQLRIPTYIPEPM